MRERRFIPRDRKKVIYTGKAFLTFTALSSREPIECAASSSCSWRTVSTSSRARSRPWPSVPSSPPMQVEHGAG